MPSRNAAGQFRSGAFSAQVTLAAGTAKGKVRNVVRGASLKLFSAVILDTPVLSGRLRANWRVSEGAPILQPTEDTDKTGGPTVARVTTVVSGSSGDKALFLTNNLPYAARVEYDGWSHTKAPQGMVRRNVRRINDILQREARQ